MLRDHEPCTRGRARHQYLICCVAQENLWEMLPTHWDAVQRRRAAQVACALNNACAPLIIGHWLVDPNDH
eukprot:scaffold97333_cov96-Phaeocystis_antarctica.AAC.4